MGAPGRFVSGCQYGPPQDRVRGESRSIWEEVTRKVCWIFPHCLSTDASPCSASQRTLLLFVIRDHIGATPLANLQATLTADLQRIWDTLSKPADLQDRKLTDYFDLSFTALPHKILASENFESDVRALRGRFTDKSRDDYLFKPAYHKRIPADGVAFYMEGIWVRLPIILHRSDFKQLRHKGTSSI